MNKKTIIGGVVAGLLVTTGIVGAVSAQTPAPAPTLTEAQAIEIALKEVPGEVQETELDRKRGTQVYEVEITNAEGVEMEVEINADTGEVLEVEADGKGDCNKRA